MQNTLHVQYLRDRASVKAMSGHLSISWHIDAYIIGI